MSNDLRYAIMSRVHDVDVTRLIVEKSPWSALRLDPNATYTVEDTNGRRYQGLSAELTQKIYEHREIESYVPWLDGAREHLYNLAVWREGY